MAARLTAIEDRLEQIERRLPAVAAGPLAPPPPTAAAANPAPAGPPAPHGTQPPQSSGNRWEGANTENMLKWTGVALVVAACAFMVNNAITRGWVQPIHQLIAAVGVALVFAWLADNWNRSRPRWSLAAGVGSVLVLTVTTVAANRWLNLIDVPAALAATVVVAAFGIALAVRINRGLVASLALTQALAIPIGLEAIYRYDLAWSAAWTLVIAVAATALALTRRWPLVRISVLTAIGLTLPAVLADVGAASSPMSWLIQIIVAVLAVVAALPLLANWGDAATTAENGQATRLELQLRPQLDHLLAFLIPGTSWLTTSALWAGDHPTPFVGGWSSEVNYGLLALAIAVLAAIAAALALRTTNGVTDIVAHLAAPIRFAVSFTLGAATLALVGLTLVLPGSTFGLAAASVASLGLLLVGHRNNHQVTLAIGVFGVLCVGGVLFFALLEGMVTGLTATAAVSYLLVLAIAAAAAHAYRGPDRHRAFVLGGAAWLGLMMWLWAVLGQLAQGQMLVSLAYGLMGTAALMLGRRMSSGLEATLPASATQVAGLGLVTLGATVVKLVTVDLVAVDTLWRSLLFFVVGLGLLRIGLSFHQPDEPQPQAPAQHST